MDEETREELLGRAADGVSGTDDGIEVERLEAYREGRLSVAERNVVEEALAASAVARRQLAEIAGTAELVLPPGIRRRVLVHAPRPKRWRRVRGPLALAASLLVAVSAVLWMNRGPVGLPGDVRYDVRGTALAHDRGQEPSSLDLDAFPSTEVSIAVTPHDLGVAKVDFALYVLSGDTALRVDSRTGVDRRLGRGSAVFTAAAESLVGVDPGRYSIAVVVAASGELPGDQTSVATLESLANAGTHRMHPITLNLLDEPAGSL